ncbi:MAG: DUF2508 family protein [Lactobacillus sp.]|nr:DUF2508 family protein [Lactobacillus sp.]
MRRNNDVKAIGDARLNKLIEEINNQLMQEKIIDQTVMDLSIDNEIAHKILAAKYHFLFEEARSRNTRFSGISNAISE